MSKKPKADESVQAPFRSSIAQTVANAMRREHADRDEKKLLYGFGVLRGKQLHQQNAGKARQLQVGDGDALTQELKRHLRSAPPGGLSSTAIRDALINDGLLISSRDGMFEWWNQTDQIEPVSDGALRSRISRLRTKGKSKGKRSPRIVSPAG